MPPDTYPPRFDPHSINAVLATLIAQQKALAEKFEDSERATQEFRGALVQRLDDGSFRMDTLADGIADVKRDLAAVKIQTTATNGRVNKHDDEIGKLKAIWRSAAAKITGATCILTMLLWLFERGWLKLGG